MHYEIEIAKNIILAIVICYTIFKIWKMILTLFDPQFKGPATFNLYRQQRLVISNRVFFNEYSDILYRFRDIWIRTFQGPTQQLSNGTVNQKRAYWCILVWVLFWATFVQNSFRFWDIWCHNFIVLTPTIANFVTFDINGCICRIKSSRATFLFL